MHRALLFAAAIAAGGCQSDDLLGVWSGDLECEHQALLGPYDVAAELDLSDGAGAAVSGRFYHDAETLEGPVFSWTMDLDVSASTGDIDEKDEVVSFAVDACQEVEAMWEGEPWYTACDQIDIEDFQTDRFQLIWNGRGRVDYEDSRCVGTLTR